MKNEQLKIELSYSVDKKVLELYQKQILSDEILIMIDVGARYSKNEEHDFHFSGEEFLIEMRHPNKTEVEVVIRIQPLSMSLYYQLEDRSLLHKSSSV